MNREFQQRQKIGVLFPSLSLATISYLLGIENPIDKYVRIQFYVAQSANVSVSIKLSGGQNELKLLDNEFLNVGTYEIGFNSERLNDDNNYEIILSTGEEKTTLDFNISQE